MDRLLALSGGQPLRSNDWDLIQDVSQEMLRLLITGLRGGSASCIISGLTIDAGDGSATVAEGAFFYDGEVFFAPEAHFTGYTEEKVFYLVPNFTTTESRRFKDETDRDVYQLRRYGIGMGDTIPEGGMPFPGATLRDLLKIYILASVPAAPTTYLKYKETTISAALLDQYRTVVPAPTAGKTIKVIGLAARILPTVPLDVAGQTLDIFYGTDHTEVNIGRLSTGFLQSSMALRSDMEALPGSMYEEMPVSAQLSDESAPTGIASITFYCYYVEIS